MVSKDDTLWEHIYSALVYGTNKEIESIVKEYCEKLGSGDSWGLGSSTSIMDGIPPDNFVTMIKAGHKYGVFKKIKFRGEYLSN